MEKNLLVKIIVVAVVALFILELFVIGGGSYNISSLFPEDNNGIEITGTTTFNGTIRTYDPILVLPLNTSQKIIDDLKGKDGVKNTHIESEGIIIETEVRDDVYSLASYLREQEVVPLSVANIALPQTLELELFNGEKQEISTVRFHGMLRIVTEPVVDAGVEVPVSLVGIAQDDELINYHSGKIMLEEKIVEVEALIEALNYMEYTYTIPWEERNNVSDLMKYGEYEYNKLDSIVFNPPLTMDQIMTKKYFYYITYIDANGAQVESSFDNATQLNSNFKDTEFRLPSSTLIIKTDEEIESNFSSDLVYSYKVKLLKNSTEYEFDQIYHDIVGEEKEIDEIIKLNISIVTIADQIITINDIIPS